MAYLGPSLCEVWDLCRDTVPTLKELVSEFHTENLHRIDTVCVFLFNHISFVIGEIGQLLRHLMIIYKCLCDKTGHFPNFPEVSFKK